MSLSQSFFDASDRVLGRLLGIKAYRLLLLRWAGVPYKSIGSPLWCHLRQQVHSRSAPEHRLAQMHQLVFVSAREAELTHPTALHTHQPRRESEWMNTPDVYATITYAACGGAGACAPAHPR